MRARLSPRRALNQISPLAGFLERPGYLVIDGGLATELEARGYCLNGPLWSARLLGEAPHSIAAVHRAYLRAGADCLISSSYQATLPGLTQAGYRLPEARRLLRFSVQLALDARDALWDGAARPSAQLRPLVAASIGPYGAYLADGSEYDGNYGLTVNELRNFHQERFSILSDSGADLLACETIPSLREAEALAVLLERHSHVQAWISFSCRDASHLCDGTSVEEAVRSLADHPRIVALGVNCTSPHHAVDLTAAISVRCAKPILAYPNSGESYDAASGKWQGEPDPQAFGSLAVALRAAGAALIGGCCRTGPAHIAQVRAALDGKAA